MCRMGPQKMWWDAREVPGLVSSSGFWGHAPLSFLESLAPGFLVGECGSIFRLVLKGHQEERSFFLPRF